MTKRSLVLLIAIVAVCMSGCLRSNNRISDTDNTYTPVLIAPSNFYAFYDKKKHEEVVTINEDYKEIHINSKFYRYKGQDNHGWTIWERKEK